jgi:hypothetical protein
LCKEYEQQTVSGSLCFDICRRQNLTLSATCADTWHGYQIFHQRHFDIKVESSSFITVGYSMDLHQSFIEPSAGVSMEQFNEMIAGLIRDHLGPGEHSDIIHDLLSFADANRNGQVSLAEAKSIWALARQREFLVAFLLRHSSLAVDLHGFCGNLFATTPLPTHPLYSLPSATSWYSTLFLPFYRFRWPAWSTRAKHAVALLEFVSEIHDGTSDSFYLCDASIKAFGYDKMGDLKLTAFESIYSRYEIESSLIGRSCSTDADCVAVEPDCTALCDDVQRQCSLPYPNLYKICRLLSPYLIPGAPRTMAADILYLLDRCKGLNMTAPKFILQQTIVISELKSILWRHISSTVS